MKDLEAEAEAEEDEVEKTDDEKTNCRNNNNNNKNNERFMMTSSSDDDVKVTTKRRPALLSRDNATRRLLQQQQGVVVLRGFRIDPIEATLEEYYDEKDEVDEEEEELILAFTKNEKEEGCWLDVDGNDNENRWIDKLQLSSFVTKELRKPILEWHSHVISTRKQIVLKMRILPDDDVITIRKDDVYNDNQTSEEKGIDRHHSSVSSYRYVAAICSQPFLVTWNANEVVVSGRRHNNHKKTSLSQQVIAYMTEEEDVLHAGTSSGALIAWIEFHLGRTSKAMMDLRTLTGDLVRDMDEDPSRVPLEDIMQLKNKILISLAVAEEQCQCLDMVKKVNKGKESSSSSGVDFSTLKGALLLLVSTAESTERMGIRLEKRCISLRQQYDSYQQDRMNHRLAILTVISAIFMPLTFIAGIYGMNFDNMPELGYEYSYFILLATLLSIAITMIAFFYSQGWFE